MTKGRVSKGGRVDTSADGGGYDDEDQDSDEYASAVEEGGEDDNDRGRTDENGRTRQARHRRSTSSGSSASGAGRKRAKGIRRMGGSKRGRTGGGRTSEESDGSSRVRRDGPSEHGGDEDDSNSEAEAGHDSDDRRHSGEGGKRIRRGGGKVDIYISHDRRPFGESRNNESRHREDGDDEDEISALRRERNLLRRKLANATAAQDTVTRGKNVGRRHLKTAMGREDEDNQRCVASFLRNTLFSYCKFLPNRWWVYGTDKRKSVCSRVMYRVNVPEDQDGRSYWNNYVSIWINDKYVQMRSNFKEQCRRQYTGE